MHSMGLSHISDWQPEVGLLNVSLIYLASPPGRNSQSSVIFYLPLPTFNCLDVDDVPAHCSSPLRRLCCVVETGNFSIWSVIVLKCRYVVPCKVWRGARLFAPGCQTFCFRATEFSSSGSKILEPWSEIFGEYSSRLFSPVGIQNSKSETKQETRQGW